MPQRTLIRNAGDGTIPSDKNRSKQSSARAKSRQPPMTKFYRVTKPQACSIALMNREGCCAKRSDKRSEKMKTVVPKSKRIARETFTENRRNWTDVHPQKCSHELIDLRCAQILNHLGAVKHASSIVRREGRDEKFRSRDTETARKKVNCFSLVSLFDNSPDLKYKLHLHQKRHHGPIVCH